jgi:Dna[CI] antecedent, DciA
MFIMVKRSHNLVQGEVSSSIFPVQPLEAITELGLIGVIKRAQSLDALDQTLRQYLPTTLAENCRLANVDGDKLVYSVSNPVWKAKLRLYGDALISAANEAGVRARTLTVKVIPQDPLPLSPSIGKPLTQAVRDALRTTAHSVEDPKLREQLLKLASLP